MPSPIFDAPLTSTLVPTTAGNPAFTFTRATTAYVSAVAAAGNAVDGEVLILCDANEARFAGARRVSSGVWSDKYADGSAIPAAKLLGYVAENAATNICLQSQTFDHANWTKLNVTTTPPDTQAAPDGTLTADVLTDNATSGQHVTYSTVPFPSATVCTASLYLKAGTLTWAQMLCAPATTSRWANFNLVTGVVGNKDAGTTATITALPNGWYRCTITFTSDVGGGGTLQILASNANSAAASPSYAGTGQTMYLWGAQVEASSDPSSYVPTTTVAVVRATDALTYPMLTNLDGALATIYAETYLPFVADGATQYLVTATVTSLPTLQHSASAPKKLGLYSGGFITTVNALNIGAVNKNAAAYSGATCSVCLNGGVVALGAYAAGTNVGNLGVGGGGGPLRGMIRNVKFYATRLTDAQLIQLTTDGFLPPDVVPVVPSTEGGIGARVRRYRRIEVEIDGEIFPVASEEEGRELLLKAREAAKQAAQAAAVRAAAKAEKKTSPAAVERALALSTPRISLRADDRSEALAQAIQAQVDAAQAAIDEDYATARRMAYAYVRQRLQEEQRQRELAADEEEVIAMILRLP